MNGRRRRNTIFSVNDGDVTIEGTSDLLAHATNLYKTLFGHADGNLCSLDANVWDSSERLADIDNFILTRPFSEIEI